MPKLFHLRVLAVDRVFFEGDCASLSLPLTDGQLGLLANHSPMAAAVAPGRLTLRTADGAALEAVAGCGIVRFADNDALVLLEDIARPEEIDAQRARQDVESAREALRSARTEQERLQAQNALRYAESLLRAAGGED